MNQPRLYRRPVESDLVNFAVREEGKTLIEAYDKFKDSPYSFFLDSALPSDTLGKFSFAGRDPFLIFKSKKDHIELDWRTRKETLKGNPFFVLRDLFRKFRKNFSFRS